MPMAIPPIARTFRRKVGSYYGAKATASGYPGFTINTLFLWPVWMERDEPMDRIAFVSSSSVAGNAKYALYRPNEDCTDGTLLSETASDASTAATGIISGSLASTYKAPAGLDLLGVCFSALAQGNACAGAGTPAMDWMMELFDSSVFSPAAANGQLKRTAALTYVAGSAFMPATLGGITVANAVAPSPILMWRAAA